MEFSSLNVNDVLEYMMFYPKSYDFSKSYQFKIRRQGGMPDCSACSVLTYIEYLRQIDGYPYENFSVIYQYYMSRVLEGIECEIQGIYLEDSIKNLIVNGVLEPTKVPINKVTINNKPTDDEINRARERIILDNVTIYNLENNLDVFKYVLTVMGVPFVMSFTSPIEKLRSPSKEIMKIQEGDVNDGHHAVCVVGYDDEEQVLIFQNSYGPEWKYDGFGKLHYSCIPNIRKAIALNKSCIKADGFFELHVDDYMFIADNLIKSIDVESNI